MLPEAILVGSSDAHGNQAAAGGQCYMGCSPLEVMDSVCFGPAPFREDDKTVSFLQGFGAFLCQMVEVQGVG